jgi:hypothetical protein
LQVLTTGQQLDTSAAWVMVDENSSTHTYHPSVNWVLADRVSEFFVEVWAMQQNGSYQWYRPDPVTQPQNVRKLLWCGNAPNCQNWYQRTMPRMIRVTLVVHPHTDTAPLSQEPYAAAAARKPSPYTNKYQGMVFREVFRVNGLVANNP